LRYFIDFLRFWECKGLFGLNNQHISHNLLESIVQRAHFIEIVWVTHPVIDNTANCGGEMIGYQLDIRGRRQRTPGDALFNPTNNISAAAAVTNLRGIAGVC
jgi:hypothetical protein